MHIFICFCGLLLVIYSVRGDEPYIASGGSASFKPYIGNHNPIGAGYQPYHYNIKSENAKIPILSYSSSQGIDGSYSFSYSTGDGKHAQENGFLKDAFIDNTGAPQGTQVKEGSFGYISPEGTPIQVSYIADENGFRPAGIHISSDGRDVLPASFDGVKGSQIYDPRYNSYDPYNRNRGVGQYNNYRHYDPIIYYPNEQQYNLYRPYRAESNNKVAKDEDKKEKA